MISIIDKQEKDRARKRRYNQSEKGKATRHRWRLLNKEREREINRKYEMSPKGQETKRRRNDRYKDIGKTKQYSENYRKRHPERRKESQRRYRDKVMADPLLKEHARQKAREWRSKNLEKSRQTVRAYYEKHKVEILDRTKKQQKELKERILTHYGSGKCACVICGENRIACLSIDHIDGTGYEHRKKVGNGVRFYKWLEKNSYPEGYQTLCMNCQFVKREESRECQKR